MVRTSYASPCPVTFNLRILWEKLVWMISILWVGLTESADSLKDWGPQARTVLPPDCLHAWAPTPLPPCVSSLQACTQIPDLLGPTVTWDNSLNLVFLHTQMQVHATHTHTHMCKHTTVIGSLENHNTLKHHHFYTVRWCGKVRFELCWTPKLAFLIRKKFAKFESCVQVVSHITILSVGRIFSPGHHHYHLLSVWCIFINFCAVTALQRSTAGGTRVQPIPSCMEPQQLKLLS